jgi:phosphoribosylanthranilate isomerase
MSLWIKICGHTCLADARLAVEAGADAVGFVLAPSPRRITVPEVASIVSHLATPVEKIGVFVDAEFEQIESAVRDCGLTGVQLHFAADRALPARLRERFGPTLRILHVLHFEAGAGDALTRQLSEYVRTPSIDGVLVDSRSGSAVGGTGLTFDWVEARRTIFSVQGKLKLVAAGGLNPSNVARAIATLDPWGVDVASGVEQSPGRKDPVKVRAFIERARAVRGISQ